MLVDLHFLRPLWFLALIPLASVVALLWQRRRGAEVWQGVVDPHLLPHLLVGTDGRGRWFPALLLALSGALVITAIAGPVWQRLPQPLFETHIDRVILLDLSPTMNAGDLKPSRLARARFEVLDLLRQAREGQTALLAFGPEPYVVSPLTSDADTIALQVPHLDTALLPEPGRRRVDLALNKAGDLLDQAGAVDAEVILITDGLDIADRDAVAAVALKEAGHRLSILGVGTPEGAPVPTGDGGFLEDRSGAILMPRLDAARLAWLAAAGGGDYVSALPCQPGRPTEPTQHRLQPANSVWHTTGSLSLRPG